MPSPQQQPIPTWAREQMDRSEQLQNDRSRWADNRRRGYTIGNRIAAVIGGFLVFMGAATFLLLWAVRGDLGRAAYLLVAASVVIAGLLILILARLSRMYNAFLASKQAVLGEPKS